MDPDATLSEIRTLANALAPLPNADAMRLQALVHALDEWLARGGFLPQAWAENCDWDRQMREQHIRRRHV